MTRRQFITLLGGAMVSWPLAARAQQSNQMRRVGVMMGTVDDVEGQTRAALLRQGFTELGWTEGRNIHIDYRWVGGDATRAKANAAELVSQKPDVIIANTTLSLAAVRNETHDTDCVCGYRGSDWTRLRPQLGASAWQYHGIYRLRVHN